MGINGDEKSFRHLKMENVRTKIGMIVVMGIEMENLTLHYISIVINN